MSWFFKLQLRKPPSVGLLTLEPETFRFFSFFHTWHARPRRLRGMGLQRQFVSPPLEKWAVVMQGPIVSSDNFTLETLMIYRYLFPDSRLILSTWSGELSQKEIDRLRSSNVQVVLSDLPTDSGPSNISLQQASTQAGLREAGNCGATFVVKTRTDQRFHAPNSLNLMEQLLHYFPAKGGSTRLGTVSLDTLRSRRFGLSDMLQFGSLQDLVSFWDFEPSDFVDSVHSGEHDWANESFLAFQFLSKEQDIEFSAEAWMTALRSRFLICDASSIDLYWNKYSNREYLWRRYGVGEHQEFGFADWLANLHR